MDLAHLETFISIYRNGNLSKAGEELSISQAAVSNHLKSLEAHLGRKLFVRLPRGVAPTPLGDTLARLTAGPLQELQSATASVAARADDLSATIYLGGPADALSSRIMPALEPLTSQGLSVHATTGTSSELLALLGRGELDLVVTTIPGRELGTELVPLMTETLALVGGKKWRERPSQVTPESLAAAPMIAYDQDLQLIRRYWREVFGELPTVVPRLILADIRGLIRLVASGAGWAVVPTYLAANELAAGDLQLLLTPESAPSNTLYLATRAGAQSVIGLISEHLIREASIW